VTPDRAHRASGEAPAVRKDPGASLVLPGPYAAVVFDMDGLLVDSEPLWVEAEAELLERNGGVFTEADRAATHGRSIEESVEIYAARLGGLDRDVLRAELLALMERRYLAGAPLRPGARELVTALRGRVPLAVASSTTGVLVRLALDRAGLLDAFDVVASGVDLGAAKPDPVVYLEACRLLGVVPGMVVAFEDSPVGVRAARTAGIPVVGVPDRPGVDLAALGAFVVLDTLGEVVVEP
jgi:HAD superfamily hydrolase (TIGR01509 family)